MFLVNEFETQLWNLIIYLPFFALFRDVGVFCGLTASDKTKDEIYNIRKY